MSAADQSSEPAAPTDMWAEDTCAYLRILRGMAEIGADIAQTLHALTMAPEPHRLHPLEIVEPFCDVTRSLRLTMLLARKLAQPQTERTAQPSHPAEPLAVAGVALKPGVPDAVRVETDRLERLEDPGREFDLNRPIPVMLNQISRGLGLDALNSTEPPEAPTAEDIVRVAVHLVSRSRRRAAKARQRPPARPEPKRLLLSGPSG